MNRFDDYNQTLCEDNVGAALRTIDGIKLFNEYAKRGHLPPHLIRELATMMACQKRIISREQKRMPMNRGGNQS